MTARQRAGSLWARLRASGFSPACLIAGAMVGACSGMMTHGLTDTEKSAIAVCGACAAAQESAPSSIATDAICAVCRKAVSRMQSAPIDDRIGVPVDPK